jgi:hypothetical protein
MTPAALILTSDLELSQTVRAAVERFGIDTGFALRTSDALDHLQKNKFDLLIVDCSALEQGCNALRQMRMSRTHRSAVAIAIVGDREHAKYVCDSGANFVVKHASYETEISTTLRTAYGLVLRERGRYNRFPLDVTVEVRDVDFVIEGMIENISQGGVCVRGISRTLSCAVELKFALDEPRTEFQIGANAVWQRHRHVGFQFTTMSPESRINLDSWLAREFERVAKVLPPRMSLTAGAGLGQSESSDHARVFGKSGEIRAIVTAVIRGGPVRARCSSCQMTMTFGNFIGAPLDQERRLREAFAAHLEERHPEELGSGEISPQPKDESYRS